MEEAGAKAPTACLWDSVEGKEAMASEVAMAA
jgi:hypothetical protein